MVGDRTGGGRVGDGRPFGRGPMTILHRARSLHPFYNTCSGALYDVLYIIIIIFGGVDAAAAAVMPPRYTGFYYYIYFPYFPSPTARRVYFTTHTRNEEVTLYYVT